MIEKSFRETILVFVKYPEAGKVKTRLAASIGAERAANLYHEWIGQVLRRLESFRPENRVIGYYDGALLEAFGEWDALVDLWWPQPTGDLGVRLDKGFRRGHRPSQKVLAIGTDCLEVDRDLIRSAFDRLDHCDVVLGPSSDGGYYLVGTADYRPGLFEKIRWSSSHTFGDQVQRCRENGWSVECLSERSDIDTWDDWQNYCVRLGRSPGDSDRRKRGPPTTDP